MVARRSERTSKSMIKNLQHFLQRDSDITYYEEFHYIYITLKELVKVIKTHNK
jgi:hypothetical protein